MFISPIFEEAAKCFMYKKPVHFFFIFIVSFYSNICGAQIFPHEGSKLCYRITGFSFPAVTGASKYKIEIAQGTYNTESSFKQNICVTVSDKKNKIIGEVPYFGCAYTWRYVCETNTHAQARSPLYHFSTKITPDVDSSATRLRIMKHAEKYKDDYVFADGARVLYDMNGKPVWFLPGTDLPINRQAYPRDLKITPQGTITFIVHFLPYEITYDGKILWQYKNRSADRNDTFHHEFTRLNNGHYMGMLFEDDVKQIPLFKDSIAQNASDSARLYREMKFNSIVEYDANQHEIWRWDDYDYLRNSDLWAHKTKEGAFDLNDLHENSFYFDERNKVIYVGFRNVNRIVKIKYPEGTVLESYGPAYKAGATHLDAGLFCGQHSCKVSKKGNLYLFNNNTCSSYHIPTIEVLQQPGHGENELKKIWEYQCTVEGLTYASSQDLMFYSGGNVVELRDEDIFASMGVPYCKIFIVGQDKKLLWSAIPEKYDQKTGKWEQPHELYRASIISRKDIEQLIWTSEKYGY